MEVKSRSVFAGALVIAAVIVAVWFAFARGEEQVAPAPTADVSQAEPAAPAVVTAAVASSVPASPMPIAEDPSVPATKRIEVEVAATKNATLRGRCVDAASNPLAGCKVTLRGWEGNSTGMEKWLTDHGRPPEWQAPPDVTTGADGTFAITFWPPPPFQFVLEVKRDGCGTMSGRWGTLAENSQLDVGDVAMEVGVRVTGRVVDASGVPQEKVYVTLRGKVREGIDVAKLGPRWGEQTVSGAGGAFSLRGWLHPGEYEVTTQQFELQSPKSVTLSGGRPVEEIMVVVAKPPAQAMITGRVLDETGAPARGVEIQARSEQGEWSNATSGRDGAFELRRRGPGEAKSVSLSLVAGTYEVADEKPRDVEWGSTNIEFRVVRAGTLTLRVTDPEQSAVENYTVRLIPRNRNRWSSDDARARAQGKHADGTAVIDGLTRGDWLLLVDFATATGFDSLFVTFTHESGPRRMDLRATPSATRSVRIVVGDDVPVAGTKVQIVEPFDQPLDDVRLVMQREHWLMNSGNRNALVLDEGTTGADGRVKLRGPAGRAVGVCVLGPGHVPLRESGIRMDVADDHLVRVSQGARWKGRIVPPEALAELVRLACGAQAGAFSASNRPRLSFADDQRRRFPSDHVTSSTLDVLCIADDGSFDVQGVPPGFWKVRVDGMIATEGGGGHGHSFRAGEVTLVDGQTTTQDIDLSYVLPGTIEGTVLLNGQPLANQGVSLSADGYSANARTDGEGRFKKQVFAGTYQLQLWRGGPGGLVTLRCPTRVVIARDQTATMTFALTSTKLKVIVLDAAGKPVKGVRLCSLIADKEEAWLPPTDDAGVAEGEIPSESVTLRILPKALSTPEAMQKLWQEAVARGDQAPLAAHWINLQTLVLAAGQTSNVEVRLPAASGY